MATNNYLLDTHCLIWFQDNNPKIPAYVMAIIQDLSNTIFFSQVSLFEIAIKQKIGKLPEFSAQLEDVYHQAIADDFTYLPVKINIYSVTKKFRYLTSIVTRLIDYYWQPLMKKMPLYYLRMIIFRYK